MIGREQCIRLLVPTADKNAKCHSNPQREGRSTVKHVGKNIDHQEETEDISKQYLISNSSSFLFDFF
jgi:hypothetical protein